MPDPITHSYILFKALERKRNASHFSFDYLKKIAEGHDKIVTLARQLPKDPSKYDNSDCYLPGFAYLGSAGGDIFYWESGEEATFIADYLHYNRVGPFAVSVLRKIKEKYIDNPNVFDDIYQYRLAYMLGFICHIAGDVIVHPFIDSIVRAYDDDMKRFENPRGVAQYIDLWKYHNVLEHWQDDYILFEKVLAPQDDSNGCLGFQGWQSVAIAGAAAKWIADEDSLYFLFDNLKCYGEISSDTFKSHKDVKNIKEFEKGKYEKFFKGGTPSLKFFVECVLPSDISKDDSENMSQQKSRERANIIYPDAFMSYIDKAVDFTLKLWDEVDHYFLDTAFESFNNLNDKSVVSKHFKLLNKHWNLDTGIAPEMGPGSGTALKPQVEFPSGDLSFELQFPAVLTYDSKTGAVMEDT
jgi:hypothetical protein